MDANAYLRKQGWKGAGHSLDGYGRGIKKPLLITHKQDQLGLGKKKAAHSVDDQWWMRAFDESLQNIGTGQESTLSQIRTKGINRGGLYGFFVRGEGLAGTISSTETSSVTDTPGSSAPQSGTSTPATSASDSEAPKAAEKNKRKRDQDKASKSSKRLRRDNDPSAKLGVSSTFKVTAVLEAIAQEIKDEMKKKERKGEYGPYIKSKTSDAVEDPKRPGKTLTYEAAKERREKNMRTAKKELKKSKLIDAMLKGNLPNPEKYTKDEVLANWKKISKNLEVLEELEAQLPEQAPKEKKQKKEKKSSEDTQQQHSSPPLKTKEAITTKLAKLSLSDRTKYEKRAAAKNQSLEQYVLRRIEKKNEKKL